jgi:hypothetical protein
MQVDYAVELGCDDETLEFPWAAPDGGPRYLDVKRDPGALDHIEEAKTNAALHDFLAAVNRPQSELESAKCDAWSSNELQPEEEIFGSPWKFGSYVDLLFANSADRFSFEVHERLLKKLTALLRQVPEIPASTEFLLRRCFFHENATLRDGFYVTFYVFGYGEDEGIARRQWEIALKLVGHAIDQLSSRDRSL